MSSVTTEPYRACVPKPFTRAERDSVTVLFAGLHWRLERMVQAVLENSGYRVQVRRPRRETTCSPDAKSPTWVSAAIPVIADPGNAL